jgi:hypothetical protein
MIEVLYRRFRIEDNELARENTLLVDDTQRNVFYALSDGYNAIISNSTGLIDKNGVPIMDFIEGTYQIKKRANFCSTASITNDGQCNGKFVEIDENGRVCCITKTGVLTENIPVEDDPNYLIPKLKELFDIQRGDSPAHRYSWDRYIWLYRWLGYDCIQNLRNNRQCKLYNGVREIWSSNSFHPFKGYGEERVGEDFIIRLSATKPGAISISYRNNINKLVYKRFQLDQDNKVLLDGDKHELTHLSTAFSIWYHKKYRTIKTAVGYVET